MSLLWNLRRQTTIYSSSNFLAILHLHFSGSASSYLGKSAGFHASTLFVPISSDARSKGSWMGEIEPEIIETQ